MAKTLPGAIIFDLDGTLIDSAVAATNILNRMLASRGKPATDKKLVRNWVSLGASGLITHALGSAVKNLDDDITEFRALYRALTPDPAELFPHTLDMLQKLNAEGHVLGICTNKPEDLAHHVIRGTGLEPFMKAIVGGRKDLPAKPDPAPVYEVLRQLGATSSNALYIGDSEVDAEAAAAAGLPFFLVSFGYAIGSMEAIPCAGLISDFRDMAAIRSACEERRF